jgi:hypothetical protein
LASGGFLARWIIFEAEANRSHHEPTLSPRDPPPALLDWARRILGQGANARAGERPSSVNPVPMGAGVREHHALLVADIDRDKYPRADSVGKSVWARVAENAMKLALLHALSVNPENPIVDMDAATWGWELAERQAKALIALYARHAAADSWHGRLYPKVFEFIREYAATHGRVPYHKIGKRFRREARQVLLDVLKSLVDNGEVEHVENRTHGRPGDVYTPRQPKSKEGPEKPP